MCTPAFNIMCVSALSYCCGGLADPPHKKLWDEMLNKRGIRVAAHVGIRRYTWFYRQICNIGLHNMK